MSMAIRFPLSYAGSVRPALLLAQPLEQTTRLIQQTTGIHVYARISVGFAPWHGPDPDTPVVFITDADVDPDDPCAPDIDQYIQAVAHGCAHALNRFAEEHLPLVNLCLTLTAIQAHPVDSRPSAFERAGKESMRTFFRDATFTPLV